MKKSPWSTVVGLAALLSCCGCGKPGSDLPTVTVTGTVKLNGTPLEGATVTFASSDPEGKPANGVTDAQGKFRLQTYLGGTTQADGALPGQYIVMVTKFESDSTHATQPTPEEAAALANKSQEALTSAQKSGGGGGTSGMGSMGGGKLLTPAKYQTKETTDLQRTVESGKQNNFDFDLQG